MRLIRLEMTGFKSFAQRTEVLFGNGITGVVGPNGSGKSNISDAVRWVLGEQSARNLRGASMSDVIFGGTEKRKAMSYCEVSLVFDNSDGSLPISFTEVMVTRRVWRNGEGEYYLNRASCRLKDIIDLFRDTGIGREGYSIIGQGKIDEILSRRSEDRRQVFEEAAGIVKFRARKDEADRRLQKTMENAARVDDLLEELSRRLAPLEKQAEEAREYLALSEEQKKLDANLFIRRSDSLNQKLNDYSARMGEIQQAVADTERSIEGSTLRRDHLQEEAERLELQLAESRERLRLFTEEQHGAETSLAEVNVRLGDIRTRLTEAEEGIRRAAEGLTALMSGAGTLTEDLTRSDSEIGLLEKKCAEADRARAEAEAAAAGAEEALENCKNAILQQMNRRSQTLQNRARLETMLSSVTERRSLLQKQLEKGAAEAEDKKLRREEAERRLLAEEERLKRDRAELAAMAGRIADQDRQIAAAFDRLDRLGVEIHGGEARLKVIDEMLRSMEGYSFAVRKAIEMADSRQLSGVMGTLAQLISVPEEYGTAIETALGGALQDIVVDREETARTLIDELKKNRWGRATFLPVNVMRPQSLDNREKRVLDLPGCLGSAAEVVSCAGELRGVVENLLGRTVIARSLTDAIALRRQAGTSFRMVTLSGELLHAGGSLTGGSAASRETGLLTRRAEADRLEEKLAELRRERAEKQTELSELRAGKDALRAEEAERKEQCVQQEIAAAREKDFLQRARDEEEMALEQLEAGHEAEAQLEETAASLEEQLGENPAEDPADAVTAEDEERLRSVMLSARERLQKETETLTALRLQHQDALHRRELLTREESQREKEQQQLTREAERFARQRDELTQRITAEEEHQRTYADAAAQAAGRTERQQQAVTTLEGSRQQLSADVKELNVRLEGLHADARRDEDRLHRLELNRSRAENDLKALQNRMWDTYAMTYGTAQEHYVTEGFSESEAERRTTEITVFLRAMGPVNVRAMEEYAETKARYEDLNTQQEDLRKAESDLRELIERLLRQMETTFTASFSQLQVYFAETFTRLFGGGRAELTLTDPRDPLNCGIEINVQPPGKKLQLLSLLSGGERTLTAIAILFAMLRLKPSPFCILDEIEAALDDANIGTYAEYLTEFSRGTQFIVITHRKGTMERCHALYGVAMEEKGVSKMASVKLEDAEV